jgi:hypothetical protein
MQLSGNTDWSQQDAIYRGPLKRHRASLRKLMIDSSDKVPRAATSSTDGTRWRAWMPSRDVLNFITSGRMSSLRELSIAVDYKDWVCVHSGQIGIRLYLLTVHSTTSFKGSLKSLISVLLTFRSSQITSHQLSILESWLCKLLM